MALTNPFRMSAEKARQRAEGTPVTVDPTLQRQEDVLLSDYEVAAEHERLVRVALRTRKVREAKRAAELEEARASAFDAAVAAHEQAMGDHAALIAKARKSVLAARTALHEAQREAEAGARKSVFAAHAYRCSVIDTAHLFQQNNLPGTYRDGDFVHHFETGGNPDGTARLDGRTLVLPSVRGILQRLHGAVMTEALGWLAGKPFRDVPEAIKVSKHSGGLFDDCPPPAPAKPTEAEAKSARELQDLRDARTQYLADARAVSSPSSVDPEKVEAHRQREAEEKRQQDSAQRLVRQRMLQAAGAPSSGGEVWQHPTGGFRA
jgi:hypothetical protein